MKAVIQRVSKAYVAVGNETVGEIGNGLIILLGIVKGDTDKEANLLAGKISRIRIFCDTEDKMNLSVNDVEGSALVISQFTLCADNKKGNRPSFTDSAEPHEANRLYKYFNEMLRENGVAKVETGIFAAKMEVNVCNEGPVTIILDTDLWAKNILSTAKVEKI